ncbi:hypothetical protein LEN26_008734 [Aphanomyces euteiches]|uniref:Uncharacterized protein n=1 Tax=Aphanomyces euteiches TaxID=100861 RepID=A0A6G0WNH1_9STRA|nr:hypothetical protein Ae201684_013473 [Aphanomyces euteiches]KAH9062984.1 hypothetical protein Ae201684P_009249 [Aphanomyces euteiches]KAH9110376.1 hypothetical protein AeMF1_014794 [Aphanomyces euteiches]KAH9130237.1 hypothetical protein LEN26_008734 [Aphanomyces euteiches]KAH9150320.1 hypothetical protein AeRB84_006798 [Aphanomyces euteiches]
MRVDWMLVVGLMTLVTNVGYFIRIVYLMELTQELNSYDHLYSEFVAADVVDAFGRIDSFHDSLTNENESPSCAYATLLNDKAAVRPFEAARMRLVLWFERVMYYHKHRLLEEHAFDEFPGAFRTSRFIDQVEPLTLVACQHSKIPNCHILFDYLRSMYNLPSRTTDKCVAAVSEDNSAKDEL